jgi:hypothetical protein
MHRPPRAGDRGDDPRRAQPDGVSGSRSSASSATGSRWRPMSSESSALPPCSMERSRLPQRRADATAFVAPGAVSWAVTLEPAPASGSARCAAT